MKVLSAFVCHRGVPGFWLFCLWTSSALPAPSPTVFPDNQFTAYCGGTACGAKDGSTYPVAASESGDTITPRMSRRRLMSVCTMWRRGIRRFLYSRTEQPLRPLPRVSRVTFAHPPGPHVAPVPHPVSTQRDRAHGEILMRNHQRALALIAARRALTSDESAYFAAIAPPMAAPPPAVGIQRTWYDNFANPVKEYWAAVKYTCKLPTLRNAVFWVTLPERFQTQQSTFSARRFVAPKVAMHE